MGLTLPSAIPLKVLNERLTSLSKIPKVHRLPALAEQQQPVEHLEQLRARLVDRADDRLAAVREVAEEARDRPRALRVEAGGGLVEEDERRLGDELDGDGRALAVLDAEGANDSITVCLETAHLENLLDAITNGKRSRSLGGRL